MDSMWIILSTRWDSNSVQASLNVIISVLGTVGLWAFTRFWWRRGSLCVLRNESTVPLAKLFTVSNIGEGWDVLAVLGRRIFAKGNWHLLAQLLVVVGVTLTCALAGPIAKVSLKNGHTVLKKDLPVLQAVKGAGGVANLLYEDVLWNDTARSLDDANFPTNQLLDVLPPPTVSWTYSADEWDPTWLVTCNYTGNIVLSNMTGSGTYSFADPINAFPAFRETYDAAWFDSSEYRITTGYDSWQDWTQVNQFQETVFFVLIGSDPMVDDRMDHNNDTLRISLSVLHARNFRVLFGDTSGTGNSWQPIGPVGEASYQRAECTLSRKAHVQDETKIPWPWTNDTSSIIAGYRTNYNAEVAAAGVKKRPLTPPSAEEMVRFYQIYMATINTFHSDTSLRRLSVTVQTVELSLVFLAALVLLTVLTAWTSIGYAIFLRRHNAKIKELYVPDGKIEWMIHAVKCSEPGSDPEANRQGSPGRKDSDHFSSAIFGPMPLDSDAPVDGTPQVPRLARVQTGHGSRSPSCRASVSPARSTRLPSIQISIGENGSNELARLPSSEPSEGGPSTVGSAVDLDTAPSDGTLSPPRSHSSIRRKQPSLLPETTPVAEKDANAPVSGNGPPEETTRPKV